MPISFIALSLGVVLGSLTLAVGVLLGYELARSAGANDASPPRLFDTQSSSPPVESDEEEPTSVSTYSL